ncbi:MAG TPA: hypothetical protein VMH05_01805 [Bryobacteraceae bacterium]|nr:hypothetical protein [Bryobacteraceae bacterium]
MDALLLRPRLADDGVVVTLDSIFYPLDFGLQQVTHVIEAPVHVVEAFVHGVAQIVDTAILERHSKQVAANDNSDGPPLVELIHFTSL